jgi:hypothetical protein
MARRMISGTRYTQADVWSRDQEADFAEALQKPTDFEALMHLHFLGYDCSSAKVVHVG